MPLSIVKVKATNESSYQYGYLSGSQTAPDSDLNVYQESDNCELTNASVSWKNDAILPAVTNTTACHNGFIAGWKTWCTNNAVDCVGNLTSGYFPDFFLKIHQEYQRGYTASNGSYSLCPINENNAYCTGWYNNMGERAGECGDQPNNSTLFSSHNLLGCPLDYLTNSQMIKPSSLIGTWNYVNGTISGKMVFSDYGNYSIIIPSKTPFGDYELQGSWGSPGHSLLTLCYETQSCLNNTLTTITPNQLTYT